MQPSDLFQFCPRCGSNGTLKKQDNPVFSCPACDLTLYFNPAVAAAAFILEPGGRMLFIKRAKDPAIGKLAPPGGFIGVGERAEEALRREIQEEVGLQLESLEFLCSQPNHYPFKGIIYPVVDLFFVARVKPGQEAQALDEVESFEWRNPKEVNIEEIAFVSMQNAMKVYLKMV